MNIYQNYWLCLLVIITSLQPLNAQDTQWTTVHPKDTDQALINPDMGWTMHFYSNIPTNYGSKLSPSDTLDDFPGLSTVYLRIPWSFIEPEEGRFNWAILDTPAQRWISKGKKVAFRITTSENWINFATPEWVKEAGAKGVFYKFGEGPDPASPLWDPDFDDPIYLAKLDSFLAAMSKRYNGNSNVAFIDIGTFGLWGEGHTMMSSQVPEKETLKIVKKHIDLHVKYFPDTLLCISDDVVGHDKPGRKFPATDYARSKGVSLRDDSILVQPQPRQWYHAELAGQYWPTMPVILEHEHYGSSRARNAWKDGSLLLKAVEDYHASFMSIHWWPRIELEENRQLIDKINRRLGYRIMPQTLSWPKIITIDQRFKFKSSWANVGVAPCYPGGYMTITLKDKQGGIVSVLVDETFNMKSLTPSTPDAPNLSTIESDFLVGHIAPTTLPGHYSVYVSIGKPDGTPMIALPLPHDDGQRRYLLGQIELVKP